MTSLRFFFSTKTAIKHHFAKNSFAIEHEPRLHHHVNSEAIQVLDNDDLNRILKDAKPSRDHLWEKEIDFNFTGLI